MAIMTLQIRFAAIGVIMTALLACSDGKKPTAPDGFDLDASGIPRFVRAHYLEPGRLAQISKFRSAIGQDYSDDFEHCRSMKHSLQLRNDFDWTTLALCSPVAGKIAEIIEETSEKQIRIQARDYPDFEFRIFHLDLLDTLAAGSTLLAGQPIGTHSSGSIPSEIAVGVHTTKGWKLVSYFDVMTDSLFATYGLCHVYTKPDLIISKETRDADPLTCDGETFSVRGHLPNWTQMDCRYDVEAWGYPRFVDVNYIDFDRIYRIAKFRSAVGHDYSDDFEDCRSMKHYFWLNGDSGWETAQIYAPVNGTVSWLFEEWLGTQLWIRSDEYPDFQFGIFHVKLEDSTLTEGRTVIAGQLLGTHISTRTFSDIAVSVDAPGGRKLVSYFQVMSDALFQRYQARGIAERNSVIINRQERDEHPLTCSGEAFVAGVGLLEDWFTLNPAPGNRVLRARP